MKNSQDNDSEKINILEILRLLVLKRKLFLKVWIITLILSALYIFPKPRYYTSSIAMAPESNAVRGGSLSDLASNFGINFGEIDSEDAFYPELYPDVLKSNEFIVSLFNIKVTSADGNINTDYYTYLKKYQKKPFYTIPFSWIKSTIGSIFSEKKPTSPGIDKINPLRLTQDDNSLVEAIRSNITCSIDKKTSVITITVTGQDPYICACMADSVSTRLQKFITDYRTHKSRIDLQFYTKLANEAKKEYDLAVARYSAYCDANQGTILQAFISERDKMENEMSLKLNSYNTINSQLQAAKAKIQENTPAFTTLYGAAVPLKPAGPKRILFIIFMIVLTTFVTTAYILRKKLIKFIIEAR